MVEVRQTAEFNEWLSDLNDRRAAARIAIRIQRLAHGNAGDAKSVGGGLMELRVDYGPGYRVYFVHRWSAVVILLCGGEKRTQQRDIKRAQALAKEQE